MTASPLVRFARRVALKVGRADFDAWASEVDVPEIVGWLAFWHLEPFGDEWRAAARGAVTVAGALGKLPDHAEALFMPNYNAEEDVQSEDEMRQVLAGIPLFREQMRAQGVIE